MAYHSIPNPPKYSWKQVAGRTVIPKTRQPGHSTLSAQAILAQQQQLHTLVGQKLVAAQRAMHEELAERLFKRWERTKNRYLKVHPNGEVELVEDDNNSI